MPKYKKKPVVIEAIQWDGTNEKEILLFCGYKAQRKNVNTFQINTLEGTMMATMYDYIIKGIRGEFYPCKPDIFADTYELVD